MVNTSYQETIIITTPSASGGGPAASTQWRSPVATFSDLSTLAVPSLTPPPVPGEMRMVLDTDSAYAYDDSTDSWVPIGGSGALQDTWSTINADTGSTAPTAPSDTLTITGGLGIDTSAAAKTVTLDLNAALNDLTDVSTAGVVANDVLLFNGTNFVPATIPFVEGFARNQASVTDIWLRTYANTPSNLSPVVLGFDSKLIAISASTNGTETWDAEVYSGSVVRTGGNPASPPDAVLSISASDSGIVTGLNVDYPAGTEIGVFCRGTNINRPSVRLWFIRRVV